ncbi:MAG: hypothetical protein U0441_24975 [Polyangiaceae bacterium]
MRVSLFVSALFTASLIGGVALAERPSEDGGGRSRVVQPREMVRHAERAERQVQERPQREATTRTTESKLGDKFRAHGDMNERYGASGTGAAKSHGGGDVSSIKADRNADKALHRLTDKAKSVQNCAPNDDSCRSFRVAQTTEKTDKAKAQQAEMDKQKAELKAMVDKQRAEKLKKMVNKSICEKHANMCSENL